MNRKPFTPQPGTGYKNQGGGIFDCIGTPDPERGDAVLMRNRASGWTFYAHGIGIYDDDSIDWNYSTDGHFESVSGQQTTLDLEKILTSAVQTWGKEAQADMMIEEMAELTKAILNERRGREHNIAEEMADVQIMLAQMEIIFQNSKEVARIFWEKVARLDQRLHDREEKRADE